MSARKLNLILLTLVLLSSLLLIIPGSDSPGFLVLARKRKVKKWGNLESVHPAVSSYKRPNNIKAELYCASCIAVIDIVHKDLLGKKKEHDVIDSIS